MMQKFSGMQYLMIDVANNFGLDKLKWSERIEWTEQHEDGLEKMVQQAKRPSIFMASVEALNQARNGYSVSYPIQLDATASGIQMFSILTGCERSASICNLIDNGERNDAYQVIYNKLLDSLPESQKFNSLNIKHEDVKQAIMTALYSSKAEPRKVFGDGLLLDHFYKTMATEAPGAWELNEALFSMWNPEADRYSWVMPDNFTVVIMVSANVTERINFQNQGFDVTRKVNKPQPTGRSMGANVAHSLDGFVVREMGRRCMFNQGAVVATQRLLDMPVSRMGYGDKRTNDTNLMKLMDWYRHSGFMSLRVIDHIDHKNIGLLNLSEREALWGNLDTLPERPFNLMTIHDCFRCLPNYGNDLRRQYNLVLSQIAESDMLYFLVSQIRGELTPVLKMGLDHRKILAANYALS